MNNFDFLQEETSTTQTTPQEVILEIAYKIPLEDYLDFNFLTVNQTFKKQKKKAIVLGSIELVMGILFLITTVAMQGKIDFFIMLLNVGLILMGFYSISFYKYFFPKSLKKSATIQYEKNEYLKNTIHLDFYGNKFVERADDYVNDVFWEDIHSLRKSEKLLMIMMSENRCVIIPKKQIPDTLCQMEELFEVVSSKFNKEMKLL
ncbi:MAG: YcxB family protein [Oscillospiraceae bacterium]